VDELAAVPIRRNTVLLAGSMACLSGMFQLVAAVSSLTFVKVTGVHGLLGLGPAIFLVTAALAAYQAGRGMDRFGRIPPLAVGFVVATCGLIVTGVGTRLVLAPLTIAGFVLLGAALGTLTLVRTAGGDMYPPEQRAAGIALVLSGAVVGAILGPLVFDPLLAGRQLSTGSLSLAWFAAIGFPLVGLVLVLCVRPDPRRVAELLAARGRDVRVESTAAPIREIVRRPGVAPALLGALASFSVMASVMNLIGYVVVAHGNHEPSDVFPIIGAHVFGMYAFVVIVGPFVDRFGRRRPLVGGLVLMGACCASLALVSGVVATAVLLFGLGLGWSFSFLAASSDLVDRTSPRERGRLLGLSDMLSGITAATLAIVGGLVLDRVGVTALALGSAVLVLTPAAWLATRRPAAPIPPLVIPATEQVAG
jgi:MFS family permease